jgi:flagellar biosynthesis/type III secretory pathway protein FliH
MDATTKEFYKKLGVQCANDWRDLISTDPEAALKAYRRCQYEQALNALERERTLAEGKAQGIAEVEAQGYAEGEARGKAQFYMGSLPLYFEAIQVNPSLKDKVFALGASAGVDGRTVQREYDRWLRAKLGKTTQPDS